MATEAEAALVEVLLLVLWVEVLLRRLIQINDQAQLENPVAREEEKHHGKKRS
jgi:hypothetical protein